MIKLNKTPVPAILAKNAKKWTDVVLEKVRGNEKLTVAEKSHYSHQDIKAAIIRETNGKCAYCESKIRHISYGDVEHVVPKNVEPKLWFEWNNLTLACDVCNTNKGINVGLVDPYGDDPEKRFVFFGPMVAPMPSDGSAFMTHRILDLNRDALVGRRWEAIEYLMRFLELIEKTVDPVIKKVLQEDFNNELLDVKEYAAMKRTVANNAKLKGILV